MLVYKQFLTLASDSNEPLPELFARRRKILRLRCAVERDGSKPLVVMNSLLINFNEGGAGVSTLPVFIKLAARRYSGSGIPAQVLNQIVSLAIAAPISREDKEVWLAYLEMQERIARQKQFCVTYKSHNYGAATRNITFQLDVDMATLDGITPLDAKILWQRFKDARRDEIRLVKLPADTETSGFLDVSEDVDRLAKTPFKFQDSETLGTVEDIDSDRRIVKISLDQDLAERIARGRYSLPKTGCLYFALRGDLVQIERQQRGIRDLEQGKCKNPRLSKFIFNSNQARLPETQIKLQPQELLLGTCNPDQILAVEKTLSAEDLVLIQGPPGTGKTTVIAEICYQVARRGGRTLIASQANLAVDNALSRLVHNPIIRALRKGRISSIEEEGLPFVEDRVIQTWMDNTARDCAQKLSEQRNNISQFKELLAPSIQFSQYLELEASSSTKIGQLEVEISAHKTKIEQQEDYRTVQKAEYDKLGQDFASVVGLLSGATAIDERDTELLYKRIIPELPNQQEIRQTEGEVNLAAKKSLVLGLAPPKDCHWLVLLQWLNRVTFQNRSHWLEIQNTLETIPKLLEQVVATEDKENDLLLKLRSYQEQLQLSYSGEKHLEAQLVKSTKLLEDVNAAQSAAEGMSLISALKEYVK